MVLERANAYVILGTKKAPLHGAENPAIVLLAYAAGRVRESSGPGATSNNNTPLSGMLRCFR